MYPRHPRLSLDLAFGIGRDGREEDRNYCKFVEDIRARLEYAYDLASASTAVRRKGKASL